jgi:DnaJ-class molecular chaperone
MDLVYNIIMSPLDFLFKDNIVIPHPDGEIKITSPSNLSTRKPLRLKGKGYKIPGGLGDMYLKVYVDKENTDQTNYQRFKDLFDKVYK